MKVKDMMTRQVAMVRSNTPIDEVAKKMKSFDANVLLVQEGDKIVGVITDREIVIRATAENLDPKTTPVNKIMTAKVASCSEEEDVEEAVKLMEDRQARTLIVLNSDNKPVGVFSPCDFVVKAGNERLTWEVFGQIREPARQNRYPLGYYEWVE
jgi:predicted transcriptional regulator